MNPDLEHAQAVAGANDSRPTGIIDTVNLIHCAQGIALLEASDQWDAAHAAAAKKWFAEYLHLLLIGANGKAEARSGNNHATWWTAQVAAFASLTDDRAGQKSSLELVPHGAAEADRTRRSVPALDAFATLCRIAQTAGVNLWTPAIFRRLFSTSRRLWSIPGRGSNLNLRRSTKHRCSWDSLPKRCNRRN
jgi:hypothetical protein